jgi:hypothetical protein
VEKRGTEVARGRTRMETLSELIGIIRNAGKRGGGMVAEGFPPNCGNVISDYMESHLTRH